MILPVRTEGIPEELLSFNNWLVWKSTPVEGRDKPTKVPYQVNGRKAASTRPETWTDFNTAMSVYQSKQFDGIGFAVTPDTPMAFDLDNCRCPAFANQGIEIILPWAREVIEKANTYTEVSPSGRGIRGFAKAVIPVPGRKKGDFEIYKAARYVTLTGHHLPGTPTQIMERQAEIDAIFKEYFEPKEDKPKQEKTTPRANLNVKETLEKAFNSKNGEKIKELYNGNFPDHPSRSEADMSLCGHLAYWFNNDSIAIDEAFRASGLMRDKWNKKHHADGSTYGQKTIETAIAGNQNQQEENSGNTGCVEGRIKKAMLCGGKALQAEIDRLGTLDDTIEGILPESAGLFVVYSPPGGGKTFTVLDMFLSTAAGIPYHGREVKQKPVIYVAGEGQVGVLKRIKAWCNYHKIALADITDFHLLPIPITIDDDKTMREAVNAITDLNINPGVIILDTLARSMQGDENSTADMGKVVNAFGELREKTTAQIGVVHHTGKDEAKGPRGAIALTGATDAIYKTAYNKKNHVFTLIFERYKDDETPAPIFFRAEKVLTGMFNKKGEELCSLVPVRDDEIKAEVVRGKATGLKGANQIAYRALETMLKQKGIEPPEHVAEQMAAGGVVLPGDKVVHEDTWREHCYNTGIAPKGKTQSSKTNAFNRAMTYLLNEERINCFDGYLWIPHK
jgi:putative DNA primase/helicase